MESVLVEVGEIVLLVPDALMLTVLPTIGLLNWSTKVTVIVVLILSFAKTTSVDRLTVDLEADTDPRLKVTLAVAVKFMLSVISVAVIVLTPGEVELRLAVACPFAFVAVVG